MKAAAGDQWRLLDLQALDTRLNQLKHREKSLPEHAQIESLEKSLAVAKDDVVLAQTELGDVDRELAKAEAEVQSVRDRAARDQQRLDSGVGTSKDLQALQHEVETLAQRQSVLEDVELEVMERREESAAKVEASQAAVRELEQQLTAVLAQRETALSEIGQEVQATQSERETIAPGLPEALLSIYERLRANTGMGAARLHQRKCEGCRLELNAADLAKVVAASEDDVLQCPECDRLLIRTAESGL